MANADDSLHEELLRLATTVATEAGELLLAAAVAPVVLGNKSSITDLVTETDRASEALILDRLLTARPDDGLIGEEGSQRRARAASPGWSTRSMAPSTSPTATRCSAFPSRQRSRDERSVGVVFDPLREEMFTAVEGGGAWLGERRLARSTGRPAARTLAHRNRLRVRRRRSRRSSRDRRPPPRPCPRYSPRRARLPSTSAGSARAASTATTSGARCPGTSPPAPSSPWRLEPRSGTLTGEPFAPNRTTIAARPDIAEPLRDLLQRCGAVE